MENNQPEETKKPRRRAKKAVQEPEAPEEKDKGGRPSLFKPEYIEEIIKFFDIEPIKMEIAERSEEFFANGAIKKKNEKYVFKPRRLPTLMRFARHIDVDYTTVWRWAEKGEIMLEDGKWEKGTAPDFVRFCKAYKEAKEIQKEFLIHLGLSGVTPSGSYVFTAKNVTDMRDKVEAEVEHKGSIVWLPPKKTPEESEANSTS